MIRRGYRPAGITTADAVGGISTAAKTGATLYGNMVRDQAAAAQQDADTQATIQRNADALEQARLAAYNATLAAQQDAAARRQAATAAQAGAPPVSPTLAQRWAGLPTWGKVAMGVVGAGAVAGAAYALARRTR